MMEQPNQTNTTSAGLDKQEPTIEESCIQESDSSNRDIHAPDSKMKVSHMTEMGSIVKQKYDELGPHLPPDTDSTNLEFVDLPTLGPYSYGDGATYIGQYKGGLRHGWGSLIDKDGCYEGYWQNDKFDGHGRLIHSNGDVYIGDWMNGIAHGSGSFVSLDGTVFVGHWKFGKKSGKGKENWPDGSQYEGFYNDSQKHGKGIYKWSDGAVYEGEFFNSNIQGTGTTFKITK